MLWTALILCMSSVCPSLSHDKFTKDFFEVVQNTAGNLFFSTASVKSLLVLVKAGARETTLSQLSDVNVQDAAKLMALSNETENTNVTLVVSNSIFASESLPIRPEFEKDMKENFNTEILSLDFDNSKEATKKINSWVSERTNNLIPELLPDGAITASSKLVLLNAIFFKGNWEEPFDPTSTRNDLFYLSANQTKSVPFMRIETELRVLEDAENTMVELPYKGGNSSMVIVVPKKTELNVSAAEVSHAFNFTSWLENPELKEVVLKMPRFKIEQTIRLKEVLTKMGITDLFTQGVADLSGISEQPLHVSEAIQKSVVEVNELGSEAASATGFAVSFRIDMGQPLLINLNKPFLFFIQVNGEILFIGKLAEP